MRAPRVKEIFDDALDPAIWIVTLAIALGIGIGGLIIAVGFGIMTLHAMGIYFS